MTKRATARRWLAPVRFDEFASPYVDRHGMPRGRGLNVGCGFDSMPGFVNTDVAALPGVDVLNALSTDPLPFRDGEFDIVIARDVLEHVELVAALKEIHRVLKPGGHLLISTVHFSSRNAALDPTHRRSFSVRSFDFFTSEVPNDRGYYFPFSFSRCGRAVIQFNSTLGKGKWLLWDRVLEPLVNRTSSTQDLYEMTMLARLFPAANVLVDLVK